MMKNLNSDFHLYFEYSEFDSPDQAGSYEHMNVEFLNKLAKAEHRISNNSLARSKKQ